MPDGVPAGELAPDGLGPTEGNGLAVPLAHLHVALVIPSAKLFDYLRDKVFVIQPPYWKGDIALHVIPDNPQSRWAGTDWTIRQAIVDSGLADPVAVEFAPPVQMTLGWPTKRDP